MISLLALLVGPADAAWTNGTIFNDGQISRNVAMILDSSLGTPTYFYVEDRYTTTNEEKHLSYKYQGSGLSSRVEISHDLPDGGQEAYLQSITTGDGESKFWVLAKFLNAWSFTQIEQLVVDRNTGTVNSTNTTIGNDDTGYDEDHSDVLLDEANQELHGCFTFHVGVGDDDANGGHRAIGSDWGTTADVVGGNGTSGIQDHCVLALLADGTRLIAYHDGSGGTGEDIKIRFESTPGTADYTLNLTSNSSHNFDWPTLAVRTVGGTETVHAVLKDKTSGELRYRSCVPAGVNSCDDAGDWTTAIDAEVGNSGDPTHPAVAVDENGVVYVVYADEINASDDRIRVSCKSGASFSSLDGGVVDGGADEEAFATQNGTVIDNTGSVSPRIIVNDVSDTVRVAYLRDEDTAPAAWDWRVRQATHSIGCP